MQGFTKSSKLIAFAALGVVTIVIFYWLSSRKDTGKDIDHHEKKVSYNFKPESDTPHDTLQQRTTRKTTSRDAWLKDRKAILENDGPRKVVLFCYARGGSTFFSEPFRKNPEATFWMEPLDGFYSSTYGLSLWNLPLDVIFDETEEAHGKHVYFREYPDWEKELILDFHHNFVNCNFEKLPIDVLVHIEGLVGATCIEKYEACRSVREISQAGPCGLEPKGRFRVAPECGSTISNADRHRCAEKIAITKTRFQDPSSRITSYYNFSLESLLESPYTEQQLQPYMNHEKFLSKIRTQLKTCFEELNTECRKSKIMVYKEIRLQMDMVQNILETEPETYVIYEVRDPRGIAFSRKEADILSSWSGGSIAKESKWLCEKMRHDLDKYLILSKLYPGALKLVRYEDFARMTDTISDEVYNFIGVPRHYKIKEWIISQSQNTNMDGDFWSTNRRNWTASISKWRQGVSLEDIKEMTHYCKDVLSQLKYPLV